MISSSNHFLNGYDQKSKSENNNENSVSNQQTAAIMNLNDSYMNKKWALDTWPKNKKIEKLSHYSACQVKFFQNRKNVLN
jgi:hypothetical protein